MAGVSFQVLDVGQGSGNFIEIYDGAGLGATILVDLGTERDPGNAAQTASIDYIRFKLCSMKQPTIDLLVLSHSDTDHINLILTLLANFTPYGQPAVWGKPNLLVKITRYAGQYEQFSKYPEYINVIDFIEKYMNGRKAEEYEKNYTSFDAVKPVQYYSILNVNVYTLIANVINEKSKAKKEYPHWVNTRSAVLLISYKNAQYVVTGDATGNTIYSINNILDRLTKTGKSDYFSRVFMITAPHHGSETTTFDIKGLGRGNSVNPQNNLKLFCDFLKPHCLSASAERNTVYKHPHYNVISGMSEYLGMDIYSDKRYPNGKKNYHSVTMYLEQRTNTHIPWPPVGDFYSFNTNINVFTNLYCVRTSYYDLNIPPWPSNTYNPATISPPPYNQIALGVSWEFSITETGDGVVLGRDNRLETNAALKQKLARQRPEMALGDLVEFDGSPAVAASPAITRGLFSERRLAASKPVPFSPAAPARTASRLRQLT